MSNLVFVGTSLDGYIADRNGGLQWLESIPNPDKDDLGWGAFMDRIDGIIMGRKTYETVMGFGIEWPYEKKVYVLSQTLTSLPEELKNRVSLMKGTPAEITAKLRKKGCKNLYIDGGHTIQEFLSDDLIDELIITKLPILLGGGTPLFGDLPDHMMFEHVETKVYLDELVSSRYKRKR